MLTDAAIRSAVPGDKPVKLFDGGGLYLELAPSGGKWWRLKYRYGGVEKRISLGTYPRTGLKAARQARDQAKKLLDGGSDPSASRKAAKATLRRAQQLTVEAVALAWLKYRAGAWKDGTRQMIEASLRNDLFPKLGSRPIGEVQPREVRDLVQAIEERGAGETAGRVFQRIRAIYRYAVAHDLTAVDPTYALKPSEIFKPRKAKHRGSLAEADVPEFFRRLERYDGDPATRFGLELLLLTATGPGELRGARWDEIDERAAMWRIPASRMKMGTEHLVPLSRQAISLLQAVRKVRHPGELVFPSPFYPGKPLSDGTLNSALARLGYKGVATAHGFRALFSTCSNEAGWDSDVIERQLAHEERSEVRAAYNRAQRLSDRKNLMQWWADRLDQLRPTTSSVSQTARDNSSRRPASIPMRRPHTAVSTPRPGSRRTSRASTVPPSLQSATLDPIEALRALVAVLSSMQS
jgi:integrase